MHQSSSPRHPGELVRRTREQALLSQAELANRVGLSQPALSRIETGQRNLDWATLVRLLAAFDLQPVLATEPVDAAATLTLRREAMRTPGDWFDDLEDGRMLLQMLHELPLTSDGAFGARLHGLPVPVDEIDLLVDPVPEALPQVNRWLARRFSGVCDGPDARSFVAQLGALRLNLFLLEQPAPSVRIAAPAHLGRHVLPPGTTLAVSPVHLLRLGREDRRIADLAARSGQVHV